MCLVPVRSGGGSDFILRFPAHPMWVRSAREAMRTALCTAVPRNGEFIETAVLLTSEVVSNAIIASRSCADPSPVTMSACWSAKGELQVIVYDHAPGQPEPAERQPGLEDEHGRGLALLALCAREWDVCRHIPGMGKAVSFLL
jgi:anti-sigma regulatory factor (Ser/Thr protein kinase)